MKKSLFKLHSLIFACAVVILSFASCTSEITLELKKDGSVNVEYSGTAEKALAALLNSASGMTGSDTENSQSSVIFDTKEIEYEMGTNGFSNVKAASKNGPDLTVSMTDKNGKSALFTSGVVSIKNGKLNATLSPKNLVKFYNSADSQTVMFLDMLLSPVFNEEQMTEEEYLEVLASFYGEDIAEEIKNSKFRITLKNPDGTVEVRNIAFTKLLTLNETIRF